MFRIADRPQANAIAERNGGEVMRHHRAIVTNRLLRPIWSVMLPLVQRVINRTWKQSIGATPHQLIHWAPTDLDRGLFAPFREASVVPPLTTGYVQQLQEAYTELLDATAVYVAKEQQKLAKHQPEVVPTEFQVGT